MSTPTYSGISPDRLGELLKAFRAACGMPDTQAIAALDKLLLAVKRELDSDSDDLTDDLSYQRSRLLDEIGRLQTEMQRVRAGILDPTHQMLWDAQGLRNTAGYCGSYIDPRLEVVFRAQLASLKSEANDLADEAEVAGYIGGLQDALNQTIHNSSSVKSIISRVDEAVDQLKKRERWTDPLEQLARKAKERAVRYRSEKCIDEAEVAEAGDNVKKGAKLRKQAAVLLSQDWAQAFPSEPPPAA